MARASWWSSGGAHGENLAFVLARARAVARERGWARLEGPDGLAVSIVRTPRGLEVSAATLGEPEWADRVRELLEAHG